MTKITKEMQDAEIMVKVDQKVAIVNDRVSDVVSKFKAYINDKANKSPVS